MIKYWMNAAGEISQSGPYGEPMTDAFKNPITGFVMEFTRCQVDMYKTLKDITYAYKKIGCLDVAYDTELRNAERVLMNYPYYCMD